MDFGQSSDQQRSRGRQSTFCSSFWTQFSETERGLKGLLPNAQAKKNMPFRTRSTGVNEMDVEGDYPLPLGEGRVRVSVFA